MRKTIPFLLLLLIGINSFGLLIFYWGEIQLCRADAGDKDADELASSGNLVAFYPEDKNFTVLNGNEILRDGKLFDIVKKEIRCEKSCIMLLAMRKRTAAWKGSLSCQKAIQRKVLYPEKGLLLSYSNTPANSRKIKLNLKYC